MLASEESNETARRQEPTQTTVQMTTETEKGRTQRPSLIDFLTGGEIKHATKTLQDHLQAKGTVKLFWYQSVYQEIHLLESSSSTSYGSTPNQANVSISEGPEGCATNEGSAPCAAPTGEKAGSHVHVILF